MKNAKRSPASRSARQCLMGFLLAFLAQMIQTAAFGWHMTPEGPVEMWLDRIFVGFTMMCLVGWMLSEHAKLVARQVQWLDEETYLSDVGGNDNGNSDREVRTG